MFLLYPLWHHVIPVQAYGVWHERPSLQLGSIKRTSVVFWTELYVHVVFPFINKKRWHVRCRCCNSLTTNSTWGTATVAWICRNLDSRTEKTNAPRTHLKGKRILGYWLPVKAQGGPVVSAQIPRLFSESSRIKLPRNSCRSVRKHVTHYLS